MTSLQINVYVGSLNIQWWSTLRAMKSAQPLIEEPLPLASNSAAGA
jgi:hypothetical protein